MKDGRCKLCLRFAAEQNSEFCSPICRRIDSGDCSSSNERTLLYIRDELRAGRWAPGMDERMKAIVDEIHPASRQPEKTR